MHSSSSTSLSRSNSAGSGVHGLHAGSAAFALLGLILGTARVVAQEPTPIPNWVPSQPASSGQYAPNSQANSGQQYGYGYGSQQQQQNPPQQSDLPPDDNQSPDSSQLQAYSDVPDPGSAPPAYQPQQAISPDRLEQMVAPIALYPDNLVSIILAASTYPAQVAGADQWLRAQGNLPPEQIAAGAAAQTGWDPSVKALTAFPQVLDQMAQSLQWTTDLGNAYYNQPQDVMQTIQVMRGRAKAAGNLQNTPQQEVVVDQGSIAIAPPTPEIVYVPQYDPWVVYGEPVAPYPGFNWVVGVSAYAGTTFVSWSPGIAMSAFAFAPFGWLGWGLDWFAHSIYFGNSVWCTHSHSVHDWGFAHGGGRYWGAHGEMARWHDHGGWGGGRGGWNDRGGWNHTFRSGLDRGRFASGGHAEPRFGGGERGGGNYGHGFAGNGGGNWGGNNGGQYRNGSGSGNGYGGQGHNGSGNGYGGQNGGSWAHNGNGQGNGQGYGRSGNSYGGGNGMPRGGTYSNGGAPGRLQNGFGNGFGQQTWQAHNHGPQPSGGPQQFRGGAQPSQGSQRGYSYSAPQHVYGGNYGIRPGSGYSQPYRSPSFSNGYSSRSSGSGNVYNNHAFAYGGSNIARAPSGGGFRSFGGRSNGGYSAPRAPSFSSHSFGGGGSSHSLGGGGGGHSFGGEGGHFSGGRSGGGGHSGGGHHR
jgi:hypothetical protein